MIKKILFSVLLISCSLKAEQIIVQPQGEYATIDMKESTRLINIFRDPHTPAKTKHKIAAQVDRDPGSYIPLVLLETGIYYMSENDLPKAALYCRAAMFRTVVDIKFAQDSSLDDSSSIIMSNVKQAVSKYITTPEKNQAWLEALQKVTRQFVQWDKTTPRNYDWRWICLHSVGAFTGDPIAKLSDEKKKKILDKEYEAFIEQNKKVLNS